MASNVKIEYQSGRYQYELACLTLRIILLLTLLAVHVNCYNSDIPEKRVKGVNTAAAVYFIKRNGFCPNYEIKISLNGCSYLNTCFGDEDCENGLKCCPDQCGYSCVTPVDKMSRREMEEDPEKAELAKYYDTWAEIELVHELARREVIEANYAIRMTQPPTTTESPAVRQFKYLEESAKEFPRYDPIKMKKIVPPSTTEPAVTTITSDSSPEEDNEKFNLVLDKKLEYKKRYMVKTEL